MRNILRRLSFRFIPMKLRIHWISFKVKLYIEYLRLRGMNDIEISKVIISMYEKKLKSI